MKNIFITVVLLYCCYSQLLSDPKATIFAQTFNLPIPNPSASASRSSLQPVPPQKQAAQNKLNDAKEAVNQIKKLALISFKPSKTIRSSLTDKIFMITQNEDSQYILSQVKDDLVIQRLYGKNQIMSVGQQLLGLIPVGKPVDKYTQLVIAKGYPQIYIIRDGVRDIVTPQQFINFGFSLETILQIQPCFINLFVQRYYLQ